MPRLVVPSALVVLAAAACGGRHRPPADFAPDSGLVARIREIRVDAPETACPGSGFPARYTAVLEDGSTLPFETRYDRDRPPRLHVIFLDRWGDAVQPYGDGGWYPDPDPLESARDGFTITAALRARPEIRVTDTVAPSYHCTSHAFQFEGEPGGGDGPDITVRLALGRSPFYPRLLVTAIEITGAPARYFLYDAAAVMPADWLIVESRGGRGTTGTRGKEGAEGRPGVSGCPGTDGGPGGSGGVGGPGGDGGRGGRVTVIAPVEEPFMAGLVDARTPGGAAGNPGPGGPGGRGGRGGAAETRSGQSCAAGSNGPSGNKGPDGPVGRAGVEGPRATVLTVPARDVFGPTAPSALRALLP